MARKKTASADMARTTAKAPARSAAPLIEAADAAAAKAETVAPPAARPVAAAEPAVAAKVAAAAKSTGAAIPAGAAKPAAVRRASAPKPAKAVDQGLEDLVTMGQDNLDACVTCGTIVFKGLETLGNKVMTLTRANIEANFAATHSLMAAKTLDEMVDLQTAFARDRLAGMAKESAKIGALTMDVANQALEPLRSRIDATTRTVLQPFGL